MAAVIPDSTQIRRLIPKGRESFARSGNTGQVGRAMQGLGAALDDTADVAIQVQDNQDEDAALKGKREFNRRKLEADAELAEANGDEIEAAREKYEETLKKAAEESLSGISNNRRRELYELDIAEATQRALNSANEDVRRKVLERETAGYNSAAELAADMAAKGDFVGAADMMQGENEMAIEKGIFGSKKEAKLAYEKWAQTAATRRLEAIPADERLAFIEDPKNAKVVERLDPEDVTRYREQGKEKRALDEAIAMHDEMLGLPLSEQRRRARSVKDNDVRLKLEKRIDDEFSRKEQMETERAETAYDELDKEVRGGKTMAEVMQDPRFDHITPSQRGSLQALEVSRATGVTRKFNGEAEDLLNQAPPAQRKRLYETLAPVMNDAQRKTWSAKVYAKGEEEMSDTSASGRLTDYLDEEGVKDKAHRGASQRRLDAWVDHYKRTHEGKEPPSDQVTMAIESIVSDELYKKSKEDAVAATSKRIHLERLYESSQINVGREQQLKELDSYAALYNADPKLFDEVLTYFTTDEGLDELDGRPLTLEIMKKAIGGYKK